MVALDEKVRVVGLVDESVGAVKGGDDDRWRAIFTLRPWRRMTDGSLERLKLVVTRPVPQKQLALLRRRLPVGKAVQLNVRLREAWPHMLKAELLDMEVRPAKGFEVTRAPNPVRPRAGRCRSSRGPWPAGPARPSSGASLGSVTAPGPHGKLRRVSKRGAARVSVFADSPSRLPSSARVAAFASLLADQPGTVTAVAEALVREAPRLAGCYPVFPLLRSVEDVKKHIGLHCVHVRPDRRIGLEFGCTWDREHGLGMILSVGEVIALGTADLSFEAWTVAKAPRKTKARPTKEPSPPSRSTRRR